MVGTTPDSARNVMYFRYAGLTNTGKIRDHNEDAYKLPEDRDEATLATKGYLYVLADGMGGHQKGEVASAITTQVIDGEYYTHIDNQQDPAQAVVEALNQAIIKANVEVMAATKGGGTTVVAAVLLGELLVVMNVGDSRAYLLRDDELHLLSKDHSLVSKLVEMGKISEEEASTHPRRNVLYQALGQGSDVEIHTYQARLQPRDVVVLCSDGLWGEVDDPALKEALGEGRSPLETVTTLINMANESGGTDNITVIVIQISDEPLDPEETIASARLDIDPDETIPSLPIRQLQEMSERAEKD